MLLYWKDGGRGFVMCGEGGCSLLRGTADGRVGIGTRYCSVHVDA